MACGGCTRRKTDYLAARHAKDSRDLMGGYANLTDRQIKSRLENYKRRYCPDCVKRYDCDYSSYLECKKNIKN